MLNIFKSPKKETPIVRDETSLLVKQFNGLNIQVYGTFEEPLFKAKDIGELLGIKNMRDTISSFNHKQKVVGLTDTLGGQQEVTFLTEQGLYKVLMRSRKKIAEQFQDWVCEVVEEIRKKGKYDLEERLKEHQQLLQSKEQELLKYKEKTYEEIEKTGHLYVIKTDGGTKVGKTKDCVSKRIKGLQTGNVNNIEIILDFPTSNPDLLEKCVHYILDRYRCNSNREFFDCDVSYIKTIVDVCGTVIDTLKSTYQHISKEELVDKLKHNGIELELEIEKPDVSYTSPLHNWLSDNIIEKKDSIVNLKDICLLFFDKDVNNRDKNKIKKDVEKWISKTFPSLDFLCKESRFNNSKYHGWKGLAILDENLS
jgi:prophage antirepressor-like protein